MPAYSDTLDFLYRQLPMYQRVGHVAFKKGLGNTRALLKALGNPQDTFPCIHIAGTNGKGTVAHMLASCFTAAGFRTGLYVSPHYKDFRERMKIDGALIAKSEVVKIVSQMRPTIEAIHPSFFEMTVALSFAAFANHQVDIAIIETGLGGRLDSTNVVLPILSVITNISYDHMAMLGNTLPKIAREKAGIIKRNTPVVIGEYQDAVSAVFRTVALKRHAPLSYAGKTLRAVCTMDTFEKQAYDVFDKRGNPVYRKLVIGCSGPFQKRNLVTTLHALDVAGAADARYALKPAQIRMGLKNIRVFSGYQGRWQVLGKKPLVLCDSGHNAAGLAITLAHLHKLKYPQKHFVIGFVNDKDLDSVLGLFPKDGRYYFCSPAIPRGLDSMELQAVAELYGLEGKRYSSVRAALNAARQAARSADCIFIGGSTFVVAEVV